jgi:hypothetical protein
MATILARIAERRATRSTRIISTLPSADFRVPVARPASTARAAFSASMRSSFPRLRRSARSARSTSTTTSPWLRSQRDSPAPDEPVPSIPMRSMTPKLDAHSSRCRYPRAGGRDLDRAQEPAEPIERDCDVDVSVGVDPEGDQDLAIWHGVHVRLLAWRQGRHGEVGSSDRTATRPAVKLLIRSRGPAFAVPHERCAAGGRVFRKAPRPVPVGVTPAPHRPPTSCQDAGTAAWQSPFRGLLTTKTHMAVEPLIADGGDLGGKLAWDPRATRRRDHKKGRNTRRSRWVRHRCDCAPSSTAAMASFSPPWASETTSRGR